MTNSIPIATPTPESLVAGSGATVVLSGVVKAFGAHRALD